MTGFKIFYLTVGAIFALLILIWFILYLLDKSMEHSKSEVKPFIKDEQLEEENDNFEFEVLANAHHLLKQHEENQNNKKQEKRHTPVMLSASMAREKSNHVIEEEDKKLFSLTLQKIYAGCEIGDYYVDTHITSNASYKGAQETCVKLTGMGFEKVSLEPNAHGGFNFKCEWYNKE